MTNTRRRVPGADSRHTRERLLHATVELMAEAGIDRVRTRSIAERAGVNPALVHYHFGSVGALVMEAAQDALLRTLGPSIEAFQSGATMRDSIRAILRWLERHGEEAPGSTILAEAMVKATRNASFRRWATKASQRFRLVILDRLRAAHDAGELDPELDLPAAAILLAAALDGLLFHRLVDPTLDVMQTAGPLEAMLMGPRRSARRGPRRRKETHP
jgi:TetR/AcrR family transcriptional regulator, regulator of biofilm formation and stress response